MAMSHLERIRRLSAFMHAAAVVGLIGPPLLLVALWLFAPETFWRAPELRNVRRANPDFPWALRLAAAATILAAAGPCFTASSSFAGCSLSTVPARSSFPKARGGFAPSLGRLS